MVVDPSGFMRRSEPTREERREAQRGRTLLNGKIVYGPGFTADCCIRNLTPLGAKLKMPLHQNSPDEFYLIVVRDRVAHRSRTVWNSQGEAGVSFEKTYDFAGPVPSYMQPVRRIWAELALRS